VGSTAKKSGVSSGQGEERRSLAAGDEYPAVSVTKGEWQHVEDAGQDL
jgi:hypothetical protein